LELVYHFHHQIKKPIQKVNIMKTKEFKVQAENDVFTFKTLEDAYRFMEAWIKKQTEYHGQTIRLI